VQTQLDAPSAGKRKGGEPQVGNASFFAELLVGALALLRWRGDGESDDSTYDIDRRGSDNEDLPSAVNAEPVSKEEGEGSDASGDADGVADEAARTMLSSEFFELCCAECDLSVCKFGRALGHRIKGG